MEHLHYVVATDKIELKENKRDDDIEFIITYQSPEVHHAIHQIRQFFESDDYYTDILFYTFKDYVQIIVKRDSYLTFILGLFKWNLLSKVEWKE